MNFHFFLALFFNSLFIREQQTPGGTIENSCAKKAARGLRADPRRVSFVP
jgi:hypothetical protein